MKKLIKSYSFWTAFAGSIGLLAVSIGKVFGYEISATGVEEVVMAICGVLIVFGVVKSPKNTTKNNLKASNQAEVQKNIDDKA